MRGGTSLGRASRGRRVSQNRREHRRYILALERALAREHLVEHDAE